MVRLMNEQKRFYEENGYIVLKNIVPKTELDRISDEYDKLFARKNQQKMESSWVGSDENDRQSDSQQTVKGIHNLQYHHAVFTKFLLNESLLDAVEDIMGTENIVLHHTKAHFKPPAIGAAYPMHQVKGIHNLRYHHAVFTKFLLNESLLDAVEDIIGTENIVLHHTKAHFKPPAVGAAYPMHQDYHYFPYENDSMVAAFLHLDAANPENGGLFVYPGSHKLGPQEDVGAKEGNFHYVDQRKFPLEKATPVIAERGDVVIFSYLLVHGSSPNVSTRPRRMLLVQMASADDKPIGKQPLRPSQGLLLRGVNLNRDASISKRFEDH